MDAFNLDSEITAFIDRYLASTGLSTARLRHWLVQQFDIDAA